MTETLNWDHTMIDVTNLQDAIDYFNSKGLAFTPGGHHEYWGTKNALDYFGLNYIELLTVANKEKLSHFHMKTTQQFMMLLRIILLAFSESQQLLFGLITSKKPTGD